MCVNTEEKMHSSVDFGRIEGVCGKTENEMVELNSTLRSAAWLDSLLIY